MRADIFNRFDILKRGTDGKEELYHTYYIEKEYSDKASEQNFAHYMWNRIVRHEFGSEYVYCKDYYDYDMHFKQFGYRGEGIYYKGKIFLSVEDLNNGIKELEIGDYLFFIRK
jgi:hypothetical protein